MIRKKALLRRIEQLERDAKSARYKYVQSVHTRATQEAGGMWSAYIEGRGPVIAKSIPALKKKLMPNIVTIEVCEFH